jgi:hypothetical protein
LTGLYPKINVKTFEPYKIFKFSRRVFWVFLFLLKSKGWTHSNIYCYILKRCSNPVTLFCKFENLKVESRNQITKRNKQIEKMTNQKWKTVMICSSKFEVVNPTTTRGSDQSNMDKSC